MDKLIKAWAVISISDRTIMRVHFSEDEARIDAHDLANTINGGVTIASVYILTEAEAEKHGIGTPND